MINHDLLQQNETIRSLQDQIQVLEQENASLRSALADLSTRTQLNQTLGEAKKIVKNALINFAETECEAQDHALRESEERYRTLFELSNEGIVRFEFEQPISIDLPIDEQVDLYFESMFVAEANATWANRRGVADSRSLIGLKLSDLEVENTEANRRCLRARIENHYCSCNREVEEIDPTGRKRYFLNNTVDTIKDGFVVAAWCIQTDITELREAQHALLQAEQQANQLLQTEVIDRRRAEHVARGQTNALTCILNALTQDTNLDAILTQVIKAIVEQLGEHSASLWWFRDFSDAPTHYVSLDYENGVIQTADESQHPAAVDRETGSRLWQTLKSIRDPIVLDVETAPLLADYRDFLQEKGIQTVLNVPLFRRGERIGSLVVRSQQQRTFQPEELELMLAIAQQAMLAIELTYLADQNWQAAVLAERNRLAREIHDTIAQGLTGIVVQLQAAEMQPEQCQARMQAAQQLAKESLAEARRSVWALRPQVLEDNTLSRALIKLIAQMTSDRNIIVQRQIQEAPYPMPEIVEEQLLRLGQEAIANVLKHAHAQHLWIELAFEPAQIRLLVQDDGQGFQLEQQSSGFGLTSMQQRADSIGAVFTIVSQPTVGTTIIAIVPRTVS